MSSTSPRRRRRQTPSVRLILGVVTGVVIAGILFLTLGRGKGAAAKKPGGSKTAPTVAGGERPSKSTKKKPKGAEVDSDVATPRGNNAPPTRRGEQKPAKNVEPIAIQIHTPEPGFLVEIDGVVARDGTNQVLLTPCEIRMIPGTRTIRVARQQFKDIVRDVPIIEGEEIEFAPEYDPFGEPAGYFASRFATTAVGERVELSAINELGPSWDPWIAADGLALWFAGDHGNGRGLFVARRATPYEEFGQPELLARTTDLVASPTQTTDGLLVAYSLRDKPQVRSLIRGEPTEAFRAGPVLAFSEVEGETWPMTAISADGLALTWLRYAGSKHTAYQVTRKSLGAEFPGKGKLVKLPAADVRFSADGTRMYWLEEGHVMRATRDSTAGEFETPASLCDLPEKAFAIETGRRQFTLSDDEVWLWGSDGPVRSEALFALRLQEAPSHGPIPRGRSIAPKEKSMATPGATDSTPEVTAVPEEVDPKRATLPYFAFRKKLEVAIATYDFDSAGQLLEEARRDARLEENREELGWDAGELSLVRGFWNRAEGKARELKPGDSLRMRGKAVELVAFADGVLEGRTPQGTVFKANLRELTPVELSLLADRGVEKSDKTAQLEAGVFLTLTGKASVATIAPRLQRAGDDGKHFSDHRLSRRLLELKQEAARGNLSRALAIADELVSTAPKSAQAKAAIAERDALPTRLVWKAVGSQDWQHPTPDSHGATVPRVPGGYLASAEKYRNFRLTLEWKTEGTTAQGGVWFRYPGTGDLRKSAWKIMLANDAAAGTVDRFSTGALFGVKPPKANRVKPAGEWNTLELTAEGDRARLKINGEEILDTPLSDPNIPAEGLICLDGEFGGITYRKVLVFETN